MNSTPGDFEWIGQGGAKNGISEKFAGDAEATDWRWHGEKALMDTLPQLNMLYNQLGLSALEKGCAYNGELKWLLQ